MTKSRSSVTREQLREAMALKIRHASRKLHFLITCDALHYNEHRFESILDLLTYIHEYGDNIYPSMDPIVKIESAWRN